MTIEVPMTDEDAIRQLKTLAYCQTGVGGDKQRTAIAIAIDAIQSKQEYGEKLAKAYMQGVKEGMEFMR